MKNVFGMTFILASLLGGANSFALPMTFLSIESEAGEWIGQGNSYFFDSHNSEFRGFIYEYERGFPKNAVAVASNNQDLSRPYWRLDLTTYGYRVPIELGYYHDSYFGNTYAAYADNPIDSAEIYFGAFGHGYSSPQARFAVLDLAFSPSEELARFAVAFQLAEFGAEPSLHGVLSFNSSAFDDEQNISFLRQVGLDVALPHSVPEPSTLLMLILGLSWFVVLKLSHRPALTTASSRLSV